VEERSSCGSLVPADSNCSAFVENLASENQPSMSSTTPGAF
jgi:hypothetical protein